MYTVRASDLYIGYRFKVLGAMKNGGVKQIPEERVNWSCLGTIQVEGGRVTYLGEKGDKLIAQVFNKKRELIATDCVYITDDDDQYEDWEYGVSGLKEKDDSKLRRIKDSANKDYFIDLSSGHILTDFDGIFDFVRCKDANENEFVKIPTLYRKSTDNELIISKYKKDKDFEVYPCFINPINGEIMEEIAIGCYKGSTKNGYFTSQPNLSREVKTFQGWYDCMENTNKYNLYFIKNEEINQLLRELFVVVFCSRSLDTIFKHFEGADPKTTTTGSTDMLTDNIFSYPKNCCGYNFLNKSFKFFGIEDPFDGGVEWIEGLENINELSSDEKATIFYYGTPYKKEEKREDEKNYIGINFNKANIKDFKKVKIKNKVLFIEKSGTQDVQSYYNNSVFYMGSMDGSCNIINGIPLYIQDSRRTGMWTKYAVAPTTEAYARLCYCEREVLKV